MPGSAEGDAKARLSHIYGSPPAIQSGSQRLFINRHNGVGLWADQSNLDHKLKCAPGLPFSSFENFLY